MVLNFEKRFSSLDDKKAPVIKAGYYTEYKTREFRARYVKLSISKHGWF
jgi:hypothetical protein